MANTKTIKTTIATGADRAAIDPSDVSFPTGSIGRGAAVVGVLSETVTVAQFTDGGSTSGTYQMVGNLPAGAIVLGTKIGPVTGFAGDTTATLVVGDGSDVDRYMTGTPSVFTTNAVGIECGVPSGTKLLTAANRPTLTITSSADFTSVVTNGAGSVKVSIYFIET